jgi:hypothetical protein
MNGLITSTASTARRVADRARGPLTPSRYPDCMDAGTLELWLAWISLAVAVASLCLIYRRA